MKRSYIKGKGKKVTKWDKARKELKEEFSEMGIGYCELRMENCQKGSFLGFAHAKKRRFIDYDDEEDLKTVILACVVCHAKIERLPHEEMEKIVLETIKNRNSFDFGC